MRIAETWVQVGLNGTTDRGVVPHENTADVGTMEPEPRNHALFRAI
jgi:hypothetical protein